MPRNTFHCDLGCISSPASRTPPVSLSRLVSEAGYFERTFHPEHKKLWVETEIDETKTKTARRRVVDISEYV